MCHDVPPALPPPALYPGSLPLPLGISQIVFCSPSPTTTTTTTHFIYLFIFADSHSLSCSEVRHYFPPQGDFSAKASKRILFKKKKKKKSQLLPSGSPPADRATLPPPPPPFCSLHQTQMRIKVAGASSSFDPKRRTQRRTTTTKKKPSYCTWERVSDVNTWCRWVQAVSKKVGSLTLICCPRRIHTKQPQLQCNRVGVVFLSNEHY